MKVDLDDSDVRWILFALGYTYGALVKSKAKEDSVQLKKIIAITEKLGAKWEEISDDKRD